MEKKGQALTAKAVVIASITVLIMVVGTTLITGSWRHYLGREEPVAEGGSGGGGMPIELIELERGCYCNVVLRNQTYEFPLNDGVCEIPMGIYGGNQPEAGEDLVVTIG